MSESNVENMAESVDENKAAICGESASVVGNTEEDVQNQANETSENSMREVREENKMETDELDAVDINIAIKIESNAESESQELAGNCDGITTEAAPLPSLENNDVIQMKQEVNEKEAVAVDEKEVSKPEPNSMSGTGEGESSSTLPENNAEVKAEVAEVTQKEDGDGDSYMVLEEADGDDNNSELSSDESELTENEQLRRVNLRLSERLALLEEFIEVEFSDKFGKFVKKRAHLVDVMGLGGKTEHQKTNGKRSSKSLELVGLLKIVNDQTRSNNAKRSPRKFSNRGDSNETKNQSNASSNPKEPNQKNEEKPEVKPKPRRCHRCRATDHLIKDCPLPVDIRDRKVVLRKERRDSRRDRRERDRLEGIHHPQLKAMRDRKRRLTRAITRERQRMK